MSPSFCTSRSLWPLRPTSASVHTHIYVYSLLYLHVCSLQNNGSGTVGMPEPMCVESLGVFPWKSACRRGLFDGCRFVAVSDFHESSAVRDARSPCTCLMCVWWSTGNLPSDHVVHVHGPRWGQPDAQEKLAEAVQNALECCSQAQLKKCVYFLFLCVLLSGRSGEGLLRKWV